jgi:hypothetical protein
MWNSIAPSRGIDLGHGSVAALQNQNEGRSATTDDPALLEVGEGRDSRPAKPSCRTQGAFYDWTENFASIARAAETLRVRHAVLDRRTSYLQITSKADGYRPQVHLRDGRTIALDRMARLDKTGVLPREFGAFARAETAGGPLLRGRWQCGFGTASHLRFKNFWIAALSGTSLSQ